MPRRFGEKSYGERVARAYHSARMEARRDTVEYGLRRWIIVLGVVLAPLLETIDSSIVNVALPTIQGNLGATLDEAAWVITGYLVANVIVIPLTPWLQTHFGRRQYFVTTVIGFTVASVLCGPAGSIEQLIALRILQGLFGGGLIATSQAALRDTFPLSEVGMSQGVFAVVVLVGPILAPMLGGYLVDTASWQWIFYINVLPGIASALIVGTMLRNPTDPAAGERRRDRHRPPWRSRSATCSSSSTKASGATGSTAPRSS